jgi:hypothetical protein
MAMRKVSTAPRFAFALFFLSFAVAQAAHAKRARFAGPHPIDPGRGDGMCFIEVPHTHAYEPEDVEVLYVERRGRHVFIGDPTAYEPRASPRHPYYGHHPVTWVDADHYCYISGPHHHWHAPVASVSFVNHGGFHWFVGEPPGWYRKRARDYAYVDHYYTGMPILRLSVSVGPPLGFAGFFVAGAWAPARVAWFDPGGKGPPPWAPAWGHRGNKSYAWKQHHHKGASFKGRDMGPGGGGLKIKDHGGGGDLRFKDRGGGADIKLKDRGGGLDLKVKDRGGFGGGGFGGGGFGGSKGGGGKGGGDKGGADKGGKRR